MDTGMALTGMCQQRELNLYHITMDNVVNSCILFFSTPYGFVRAWTPRRRTERRDRRGNKWIVDCSELILYDRMVVVCEERLTKMFMLQC